MKKIINVLAIVVMLIAGLFILTGCGDNENVNSSETSAKVDSSNQQNKNDNMNDEEKLLSKIGLELSKIEPDEQYYRVEYETDDEQFTFYMEKGTERNIGKYVHKLYDACKNVSTDKKIYKANFNFYMKDSSAEEYVLKSVDEINEGSKYNYIDQFGYNYNGNTISVTIGAVSDMDGQRNDDVYYPVYTISFNL